MVIATEPHRASILEHPADCLIDVSAARKGGQFQAVCREHTRVRELDENVVVFRQKERARG